MAGNFGGYVTPAFTFDAAAIVSGNVTSGDLGSPVVFSGNVGSGQIASWQIASGVVKVTHVASGGLASGGIASGGVQPFALMSGAVQSGNVGNEAVFSSGLASGQVIATHVASGGFTAAALGSGSVLSGNVASGQLGQYHHASGISVPAAAMLATMISGTFQSFITTEAVSGVRAVSMLKGFNSGGVRIAMAAISGRMPAVGIVTDNVASGIQVNVYSMGTFVFASGVCDYSGYTGERLWVGRSGQITTISGSWSSGGFASGDLGQPVGVATYSASGACSGAVTFNCFPTEWSGGPLGLAAGGPY